MSVLMFNHGKVQNNSEWERELFAYKTVRIAPDCCCLWLENLAFLSTIWAQEEFPWDKHYRYLDIVLQLIPISVLL